MTAMDKVNETDEIVKRLRSAVLVSACCTLCLAIVTIS